MACARRRSSLTLPTAAFEAVLYDADGEEIDFDDVSWTSDVDGCWAPVGASFDNDTLGVGTHTLTASATLPNGDRLSFAVGGVLVQSPYAGVYVGDLSVSLAGDYNGQTLSAGCSGGVTIVVDAEGETATGESGCLLSLFGYELDTSYVLDLENSEGDLDGVAAVDLTWFEYPFAATGALTEDGDMEAAFSELVYGYLQVDGTVAATRITRDLSSLD
jgi:hypothetical protein